MAATATARRHIFQSVFPVAKQDASGPTPAATPQLGSAPFQSSGFTSSAEFGSPQETEDPAAEKLKWERAWHNATAFLALQRIPIRGVSDDEAAEAISNGSKYCPQHVASSIEYLVSESSLGRRLRERNREDNILTWYLREVLRHYVQFQLPQLLDILRNENESEILWKFLRLLNVTQRIYMFPIIQYVSPHFEGMRRFELLVFEEQYHAEVARSLSETSFATQVGTFLKEQGSIVLGLEQVDSENDEDSMVDVHQTKILEARSRIISVATTLGEVGLGGDQVSTIFAEVVTSLLKAHVNSTYAGKWLSPSTVPAQLRNWVEEHFARLIVEVLSCLARAQTSEVKTELPVTRAIINGYQLTAIHYLGQLRLRELFDVIVDWENDSRGAIEDLKHYITTTSSRTHLTSSFSKVVSDRMLQPGASTTEILQMYIYIIRAFAVLDPKGVLLDRIARPIRRYLRDRDDTVKIIVSGLLADATDDAGSTDALVELAEELNKITDLAASNDDDGDLDWDDMSWLPDPVDAGSEYKKSKTSDVIGTLISLFETKDIFVKEFQNIMGERLLKADFDFEKEIRVLELLKLRFGEPPLQACEVMLKDILDSRRTDFLIQREQELSNSNPDKPAGPSIHTKILSRLFWPSLNVETFSVPPEIEALQERYSTGFEKAKPSRKLTWLPALGHVTVELDLEDRRVEEEVQTWQASVIYAFQEDGHKPQSGPVTKTLDELAEELDMDPSLVQNALTFWVGKLVLRQAAPDTYTVLETLPTTSADKATTAQANLAAVAASASAASASAASATSAVRSEQDVNLEKMNVFWQYIVGMLTNQGAMPLQRIVMMLKFAVPGGFPFANEELKEFLGRKVEEEKLEFVGGSYRIVKEKG